MVPVSSQHQSTRLAYLLHAIEDENGEPRYRRLRTALTTAIEAGDFDRDQMLPSSRALSDALGLSRNTVNRAYRELVAEGFVEAIDRVGYVINRDLDRRPDVSESPREPPRPVDWDSLLDGSAAGVEEPTKPADWREYPHPFVVGPGPESFPTGAWTRAMRTALREEHRGPSLHNLVDRDDCPQIRSHLGECATAKPLGRLWNGVGRPGLEPGTCGKRPRKPPGRRLVPCGTSHT